MKYYQDKLLDALNNLSKQEIEEVVKYLKETKRVELREAVKRYDLGPMGSSVCPTCGR